MVDLVDLQWPESDLGLEFKERFAKLQSELHLLKTRNNYL